jgi:hypothetical protein
MYIYIYLKIIKKKLTTTVVDVDLSRSLYLSFFPSFFHKHTLSAATSEAGRRGPLKEERREGQNKSAFTFFLARSMPMNE